MAHSPGHAAASGFTSGPHAGPMKASLGMGGFQPEDHQNSKKKNSKLNSQLESVLEMSFGLPDQVLTLNELRSGGSNHLDPQLSALRWVIHVPFKQHPSIGQITFQVSAVQISSVWKEWVSRFRTAPLLQGSTCELSNHQSLILTSFFCTQESSQHWAHQPSVEISGQRRPAHAYACAAAISKAVSVDKCEK